MKEEDILIGPNIGMMIEKEITSQVDNGSVEQITPVHKVEEKSKSITPPRTARIVAIEFPIRRSEFAPDGEKVRKGRLTVSAHQRHMGRIVIGPEYGLRGLVSPETFMQELRVTELLFAPFRMDGTTGKVIKQGSIVNHIPGFRVCPDCGSTFQLNRKLGNKVKVLSGGRFICMHEDCVMRRKANGMGPAELQWQWAAPIQMHPDDPVIDQMFQEYTSQYPVLDAVSMVPRVWGVYPSQHAPDHWNPDPMDSKAVCINERSTEAGRVIRPYKTTKQVQRCICNSGRYNYCSGLIIEASGTCKSPVSVGFMRANTIMPDGDKERESMGYKVRLAGRKRHAKQRRKTIEV